MATQLVQAITRIKRSIKLEEDRKLSHLEVSHAIKSINIPTWNFSM